MGSIMFIGQGIAGNRVIGATDDGQVLKPIDPKTLSINEKSGIRVRPEHLHQALREHAGIANHEFANLFPLGIKPEEQLAGIWG